MSEGSPSSPLPARALRRLFFTLFLRGRGSRGLTKQNAPTSIPKKLVSTLALYCLFGLIALPFIHQPLFPLSLYLHALTFAFLGVFVASSAGEILFNTQEADILLHRPIAPSTLLWAKIHVLIVVSLYIAAAMNLVGTVIGCFTSDGNFLFPLAHAFSTTLEALFCTSAVVMVYQLCLRWFGRERLEGLMTTAQVGLAIGAMLFGQIVPRLMVGNTAGTFTSLKSPWILLLPPAWFAGIDDLLAARGISSPITWSLAAIAIASTTITLLLVFRKLAKDYESGLQSLAENTPQAKKIRTTRRLLDRLVTIPPLSWWLRNPVERASFLLTAAYIARDRDTKLRLFPGLAPTLIFPVLMFVDSWRTTANTHAADSMRHTGFQLAFTSAFLALLPLMALNILQYSQQWQAADLFRSAPIPGPGPICNGARRAVHVLLTFPLLIVLTIAVFFVARDIRDLAMLASGLLAAPVFSLIPHLRGTAVPLSTPTEEAKSANRGLTIIGSLMAAMALAGLATGARFLGILPIFLAVELFFFAALYVLLRTLLNRTVWPAAE